MRKLLAAAVLITLINVSAGFMGNLSSIPDRVEIEETNSTGDSIVGEEGNLNVPSALVAMTLVLLGSIIYSTDVDPQWVALLMFSILLAGAAVYSSIPLYTVPLVLTFLVAVIHFR